ncbi:MAG: hypothetical protein ABI639_08450 [Thermoanaerobaculia bacterium]
MIPRDFGDPIHNIRLRPVEGLTVVTTLLNGTSKREVFEAVPIEVQSEGPISGH